MVLPEVVRLCDAVELAAITIAKPLFDQDIAKQFYPNLDFSFVEGDIKDVFNLAKARHAAIPNAYPFIVTDRSITHSTPKDFNVYTFLLLGRSLQFGGPADVDALLQSFQRYFEDVVCWSLRKAGNRVEILSVPREFRGLDVALAPALREIAKRFGETAILREDRLNPHDNDLDVDVLAIPLPGNSTRGGWPVFQIQCATGAVSRLEAKLAEGIATFSTVWESGFYPGCLVRAVATPDDLLQLHENDWLRMGQVGWVIDRTRLAHLSMGAQPIPLLPEVNAYWERLWKSRTEIAWQTGWQGV